MLRLRFALIVVVAALLCSGCGTPFADHRSADERWADSVCSAIGDWHMAQTSGENSGALVTLRDEGHLTHTAMARALRPGVEANRKLIAAIHAAGVAPVPDGRRLSRRLDRMVHADTSHLRRAYGIAQDDSIPVTVAYAQIQIQLTAIENADRDRGILINRWYQLPSCRALV